MRTAVIAGPTGLVGAEVLQLLLNNSRYGLVIALSRRALNIPNPKLDTRVISNLGQPDNALAGTQVDDVFCCLGTTMSKAGSKEKFYEVDFQFPLTLARVTRQLGAKQYLIISALGANKNSAIYYNRVKGKLEDSLRNLNFPTLHIFRPSLLLGNRRERRVGEDAAKIFFYLFGLLIPRKYKGIEAVTVAHAMVANASMESRGTFVHESSEIQMQWSAKA